MKEENNNIASQFMIVDFTCSSGLREFIFDGSLGEKWGFHFFNELSGLLPADALVNRLKRRNPMLNERFARKIKALPPRVGKMVIALTKLEEITSIELRHHNHLRVTCGNWMKNEKKVISIIVKELIGRPKWGTLNGRVRNITTWVPSKKISK